MTGPDRPTVAAFDFDGTLTDRDSVVPFLRRVAGTGRLAVGLASRPLQLGPAVLRRDRDRIKQLASRAAFAGRSVDAVQALADRYAGGLVADRLRSDTVARLRWHQDQGHTTVVVSASYELYLGEIVGALGIDGVIGTRLEVDGASFSGRLDGANCRGAEKVVRLDRWLSDRGLRRATCTLYAYGDSAGDRDLLGVADHAVWVNAPLDSVAPAG